MSIPDFSVKSDPSILQAFQNASAQRQQAEIQKRQVELNERQQEFNMVKETATAVGGMVSSFVQQAENRKIAEVLSTPKPSETIEQPLPPGVEGPAQMVPNPAAIERRKILAKVALRDKDSLAKAAAKELLPGSDRGLMSGRDIQQLTFVSPDGQQRKDVRYDEVTDTMTDLSTGEEIDRTELDGWHISRVAPKIEKDAAGNWRVIEPISGQATGTISSGATEIPKEKYGTVKTLNDPLLPAEDRKQLVTQAAEIERDESIKNAKKLVPTLDNVIRYIDTNNKVAIDRLGGLVQKLVALDSGNLATWEQRQPGSAEVIERIEQFFTMGVNGTLTDDNKRELKELLAITAKNLSENVKESSAVTLNRLEASYPQMNRQYLEELAGLKDFYRYINNPKRNISSTAKPKAPAGLNVDMNALDAEMKKRGLLK